MHRFLVYATYGWLSLSGVLHFLVDVVSQYVRGVRAPGHATTLYYGLNTSFSLGQVAVGALGLFLAWRAPEMVRTLPVIVVTMLSAIGWLVISIVFMEYWPPRINAGLIVVLAATAALTAR